MEPNPFKKTRQPSFLSRDMLAFEQGLPITLRLTFHSNSTSLIKIVGFTKHGAFGFAVEPVGDLTQESQDFRITDFPIMLSIVTDDDTIVRGDIYAKVELLLRDTVHATLAQGYVASLNSPSWPNGTQEDSFSGKGKIRLVTGADPITGSEASDAVPANLIWRVLAYAITLVASGDAATRSTELSLQSDSNEFARLPLNGTVTASQTRFLNWHTTGDNDTTSQSLQRQGHLPLDAFMPAGFILVTDTAALQGADNYGTPFILVEQWISPS